MSIRKFTLVVERTLQPFLPDISVARNVRGHPIKQDLVNSQFGSINKINLDHYRDQNRRVVSARCMLISYWAHFICMY